MVVLPSNFVAKTEVVMRSGKCYTCGVCNESVCDICWELDREHVQANCPNGHSDWKQGKFLSGPNAVSLGLISNYRRR